MKCQTLSFSLFSFFIYSKEVRPLLRNIKEVQEVKLVKNNLLQQTRKPTSATLRFQILFGLKGHQILNKIKFLQKGRVLYIAHTPDII